MQEIVTLNKITPQRLRIYKWLTVLIGVSVLFVFGVNFCMIWTMSSHVKTSLKDIPEMDFCLVLGAHPYSEAVSNRLATAAELYREGKVRHILISGDNGRTSYNEPGEMREMLKRLGVSEKDITLDYAGFRTLDSMYRAKNVFGINKMVIVTQDFHAHRSQYLAKNSGINSWVYVAKETSAKDYNNFRESLARVKAFIDMGVGKEAKFPGPKEHIELAELTKK